MNLTRTNEDEPFIIISARDPFAPSIARMIAAIMEARNDVPGDTVERYRLKAMEMEDWMIEWRKKLQTRKKYPPRKNRKKMSHISGNGVV